MLEIC